ncbi:MAG: hypothetical protein ACTHU0_21275 [Kofleriaceae bacterium]
MKRIYIHVAAFVILVGACTRTSAPDGPVGQTRQPEMKAGGYESVCHHPAPAPDAPCSADADCEAGGDCLVASCQQDIANFPDGSTVCKYDWIQREGEACSVATGMAMGACGYMGECCTTNDVTADPLNGACLGWDPNFNDGEPCSSDLDCGVTGGGCTVGACVVLCDATGACAPGCSYSYLDNGTECTIEHNRTGVCTYGSCCDL